MRRQWARVAATIILIGAISGCAGTTPGVATPRADQLGWTVRQALATLPDGVVTAQTDLVLVGDLDKASTLAGVQRQPGAAVADIVNWSIAITLDAERNGSRPGVATTLPQATSYTRLNSARDIAEELGWNIANVASFAEAQTGGQPFSVLTGTFGAATLTAAMGDPVDGVWRAGPEKDGTFDLKTLTAARPLGESLRMALSDGRLAVARTTEPVRNWVAGGIRLDSRPAYAAVAAALDKQGVYSAGFLPHPAATSKGDLALEPFDLVALGVIKVDAGARIVLAYHFADAATATAARATLQRLLAEGRSDIARAPWSDLFTPAEIAVDGDLVVAVLIPAKGRSVSTGWQLLYSQDNLVAHR